jgi:hypothetical protein
MSSLLKGFWLFCRFLFFPQWGRRGRCKLYNDKRKMIFFFVFHSICIIFAAEL